MDEKEWVERKALVEEIREAQRRLESCDDIKWERNKPYFKGMAWAHRIVLDAPAADVVEVCRCKDCKHWDEKYKCCIMMGLTALGDSYFYENSFCSRGERKEATP